MIRARVISGPRIVRGLAGRVADCRKGVEGEFFYLLSFKFAPSMWFSEFDLLILDN